MKTFDPPPLPFEEWDFRELPKDTDLRILTEYEYLRSSNLKQIVVNWHKSDFGRTRFAHELSTACIQRDAGFVEFSDDSPLGRYCRNDGDYDELYLPALSQWQQIGAPLVTMGQAISALFECVSDQTILFNELGRLALEVPDEVKEHHAERIAVTFDRFPDPWVRLHTENPAYLQARCWFLAFPEQELAVWELPPNVDPENVSLLERLYKKHCIMINWSARKEQILAELTTWINGIHPAARGGSRVGTGWLQKLSAYRLAESGLEALEAIELIKDRKKALPGRELVPLPEPETEENWSRAVNWVKKEMKGDFIARIREDFGRLTPTTPAN